MRAANTYRGARRNEWRATKRIDDKKQPWHHFWHEDFDAPFRQVSFISKMASKYMPHVGGGKYFKTPTKAQIKGHVSNLIGKTFTQVRHMFSQKKKGV